MAVVEVNVVEVELKAFEESVARFGVVVKVDI